MNGHIVRRRRPIQKTPLSHMLRVKSNQRRQRPPLFFSEYSHISSANEAPWWRFITLFAVTKMNWKHNSDRQAQEKSHRLGERSIKIILMSHSNETWQMHIAYFIYAACKHGLCVTSNEEVSNSKGFG
jgi:hypothetical protein